MEVILNRSFCERMTGSLNKRHGYHIYEKDGRFYSRRNANVKVPADGHWRLIADCAREAGGLLIAEIAVSREELREALIEARAFIAAENLKLEVYHARDVLNLKVLFGL